MEIVTASGVSLRINQANLLAARLKGEADSASRRSLELESKVGLARGRLALADEVTAILDNLRDRAHARSVGAFETALSGILADLFPDKGDVVLGLTTERGAPALNISIGKDEDSEDILDDSGGAVTNVISTGLQYAALSRTKNRRLMVLDEPDCWIQPGLIRNFVKVIADVSKQAKTQTFLVSHNPYTLFEGLTTVIKLARESTGVISATPVDPIAAKWENDTEPGIRYIELTNFGPHLHTKINFGPGVTSLVGNNDLGKSKAIAGSLRAVAYGESTDKMIRRRTPEANLREFAYDEATQKVLGSHAAEAKIVIGLEEGRRIEWTRKRKGTPKVMYAIYEAGNNKPIFEGKPSGRGEVPDAVTKLLNISRVDQLDVQISAQKDPVFLLNETPSTRAQLLSVGRESGHLVAWFETYKEWQRSDKDAVKTGEIEYAQLKSRLTALDALSTIEPVLAELVPMQATIVAVSNKQNLLFEVEDDIESNSKQVKQLEAVATVLAKTPELPSLADTLSIERHRELLASLGAMAAIEVPTLMIDLPELYPTDRVIEVGQSLVALQAQVASFDSLTLMVPELPALLDLTKLQTLQAEVEHTVMASSKAEANVQATGKSLAASEAELEALKATFGNHCPLCDAAFPDKGIEHAHH